ncbi:hypothetical protein [Okeania sp. SIO2B3]|uniref:hypothetical protein n=1 Tax=Okeania sp. SIO2B3 TaxID=2607784 RepID=UPI0025D5723C|nr:hypothetical protein [Okeania sp. SIO2B3]
MSFLSLNKKCNKFALVTATLVTLSLTSIESAKSVTLTSAEKNLEMLASTALGSHAMLTQALGISKDKLTFSGDFNEVGWSLNMTGDYLDMSVNIDFTGTFNNINDIGTYSSIGTIGSSNWESSGSYNFSETVDSRTAMESDLEASIVTNSILSIFDFHQDVEYFPNNGTIDSLGFYTLTFFGEPILKFQNLDYQDTMVRPPAGSPLQCSLTMELSQLSFLTLNSNNNNCDPGTIEGYVVATTPESTSTLSLLFLGTLGAASTLKRQLKPSKSIKKGIEKPC